VLERQRALRLDTAAPRAPRPAASKPANGASRKRAMSIHG
jgi:hypothetical protein